MSSETVTGPVDEIEEPTAKAESPGFRVVACTHPSTAPLSLVEPLPGRARRECRHADVPGAVGRIGGRDGR